MFDCIREQMHHEDIKAEIRKAGLSCAKVAAELELSRGTVSQVVQGKARSRRVALFIAGVLGKPPSAIWPGQYAAKVARTAAQRRAIKRAVRSRK